MSNEKREKIVDIVADIRAQNQGLPKDWYAKHPFVDDLLFLADRIESAHNRELAAKDDERLTIVANYENVISEKDAEIAELQRRLDIAESALEKIDNMCDGDMCKFFDDTHHCSACRYLNGCQTGVAHAALYEIRGKGVER